MLGHFIIDIRSTSAISDPRVAFQYQSHKWFKLNGAGGTEILSQKPKSINICGTRYPAWINGRLPTEEDEEAEAKLCYYESEQLNCLEIRKILIHKCKNCLVYKMSKQPDVSVNFETTGALSLFCTQFPKVVPEEPSPCNDYYTIQTTKEMMVTSSSKSTATKSNVVVIERPGIDNGFCFDYFSYINSCVTKHP